MLPREQALAQVPSVDWTEAEREARAGAMAVALFVGVPAFVAAAAALLVVALAWLVLLAPLVAAVLTWVAWRYARHPPTRGRPGP